MHRAISATHYPIMNSIMKRTLPFFLALLMALSFTELSASTADLPAPSKKLDRTSEQKTTKQAAKLEKRQAKLEQKVAKIQQKLEQNRVKHQDRTNIQDARLKTGALVAVIGLIIMVLVSGLIGSIVLAVGLIIMAIALFA